MTDGYDVDDGVYDGQACLRIGADDHAVRVRLTGYLDPIDGRYHWQGMIFGSLPESVLKQQQPVILTMTHAAQARITERTPWGTYSVAGVGTPPFAFDEVEL